MKRTILFLIFTTLCAGLVTAQTPSAAESEIRKAEKEWAAAVMKNDDAALQGILGDQLIYAHSTGVIETKGEYLGKLKTGVQKYDGIEHSDLTVRIYGNSAVAHSKVHMTGTTKGVPFDNKLMMLHLWVKQGSRWHLAAHQTTRLP